MESLVNQPSVKSIIRRSIVRGSIVQRSIVRERIVRESIFENWQRKRPNTVWMTAAYTHRCQLIERITVRLLFYSQKRIQRLTNVLKDGSKRTFTEKSSSQFANCRCLFFAAHSCSEYHDLFFPIFSLLGRDSLLWDHQKFKIEFDSTLSSLLRKSDECEPASKLLSVITKFTFRFCYESMHWQIFRAYGNLDYLPLNSIALQNS